METTERSLIKLGGEHTLDVSLLPDQAVVLDVGCRGFGFARDVLALRPNALVIALDPDQTIADPGLVGCDFICKALTADSRALRRYASFSTGEGNFLSDSDVGYATMSFVSCITISNLMIDFDIKHWDAVKLDCEGSEFEILENWHGPIATQLSIEFHDYQNLRKWNDEYFENLFTHQLASYAVVQHQISEVGPDHARGHWDSLLILR